MEEETYRCVAPWEGDLTYACNEIIPQKRVEHALFRLRKKPLYCCDRCAMRAHNARKYAKYGQRKKSKYNLPPTKKGKS